MPGNEFADDQLKCLEYLLYFNLYFTPDRYVPLERLLEHVNLGRKEALTPRQLRACVIGGLRDRGVIICSGERGYKVPISEKDVYAFLDRENSILRPMLERVQKCRQRLSEITYGKMDILANPAFATMRAGIEGTSLAMPTPTKNNKQQDCPQTGHT